MYVLTIYVCVYTINVDIEARDRTLLETKLQFDIDSRIIGRIKNFVGQCAVAVQATNQI